MRGMLAVLPIVAGLLSLSAPAQPRRAASLMISLLDDRDTVTRAIDSSLMLRLQNANARGEHQGWDVQVRPRTAGVDSRNLIHHAPHGPDPSDVEAWQVAEKYYPNERSVDVSGRPYTVTIRLLDPKTAGSGADARFTSGTLQVSWRRR